MTRLSLLAVFDWPQCPAVESVPDRVSGTWVPLRLYDDKPALCDRVPAPADSLREKRERRVVSRIFTSWNQIGEWLRQLESACRLSAEFCRPPVPRARGLQPTSRYLRVFFAAKRGQHARIGTCFRAAPPPVVIVLIPLRVQFCSCPDQQRDHFVIVSALDLMLRRDYPRRTAPTPAAFRHSFRLSRRPGAASQQQSTVSACPPYAAQCSPVCPSCLSFASISTPLCNRKSTTLVRPNSQAQANPSFILLLRRRRLQAAVVVEEALDDVEPPDSGRSFQV